MRTNRYSYRSSTAAADWRSHEGGGGDERGVREGSEAERAEGRFRNREDLPEDRDPRHVWSITACVSVLALAGN